MKQQLYIFYLACFLFLVQSLMHPVLVSPQCAQHLSAAWHICDGLRFGIDFMDDASPLFLYLLTPFVRLGSLLHINALPLFKCFIVILALVSGRLCFSLLNSKALTYRLLEKRILSLFPIYMVLFLLLSLQQNGHGAQLLILGVTPYLVLKSARREGTLMSVSALTGMQLTQLVLLAALTVVIDPQFLIFYLLIDIVQRRFFLTLALLFAASILPFVLLLGDTLSSYLDSVVRVLWLNFKYFNDYLYWMEKSPDLRTLVYAFVLSTVLSVPLILRLTLVRLFGALACLGFVYYILSVGLISEFALPMLYFSLFPGFCGLAYLLFTSQLRLFAPGYWPIYGRVLAVFSILLAFFSLRFKGNDLSIFSDTVIAESRPGEVVAFYNWQSRPAFPLSLQLERRSSNMPCFYPYMALHHGDPEGTEEDRSRLKALGDRAFAIVEKEVTGKNPPALIFVEDGDLRKEMTDRGLMTKIEGRYNLIGAASFLNDDEERRHDPFEYLGFRNGFAVFRLIK